MTWTTTELLASLRRRGRLPDSEPSDADLLLDADHAMRTVCLTLLRTLQEDYGLVEETTALVADQKDYGIPTRAIGGTVEDVLFVDDNGDAVSMPHIPHSEMWRYEDNSGAHWKAPSGFAMVGGVVRIAPTPTTASGSLRFVYQERPGVLVASSRGAQVTSTTSTTVVVDGTGAFGGSGTVTVDIRDQDPPFTARDLSGSATWDGTNTFTYSATPDNVAVGDWVTLENETIVVPIPDLMHSLLVAATLVHVHQSFGHTEEMQVMEAVKQQEMASCRQLLEPRVTHESQPVYNRNSPLRRGGRWGWGR